MIQSDVGSNSHDHGHKRQTFDTGFHGVESEILSPSSDYGPPGQVVHLRAREPVFFEGDSADYYYRTEKGSVFAQHIFVDGSRQISGIFPAGAYFGLANMGAYSYGAETLCDTTLVRYRRSGLKSWMADNRSGWLIDVLNREARAMNIRSLILGCRPPMQRFATFLLMLPHQGDPAEVPAELELHLTREEIGDYLGLCMETVSRCVSRLRAQQIIEAPSPHRLFIEDPSALEALANQDILDMAWAVPASPHPIAGRRL
ncbi:MAG: Crp/Fnr family transcriptional regulator [Alphaproteobacteria bacterium]